VSHTFFTDRDLGRQFPAELRRAGVVVEMHDDHFGPLTPDPVWLREVGRRGWVALSHDQKLRYRPQERDMAMRAGVPLFVLVGKATHSALAKNFVQTLPKVLRFLDENHRPFIARIYRPSPVAGVESGKAGRVELWLSLEEWKASQG